MIISSRFNGPSTLRTADRFEAVLPEPTQFEYDLQQAMLAPKLRDSVYPPKTKLQRWFPIPAWMRLS